MFKKILIMCGALFLFGIFQSSFLILLFPADIAPNLLLIAIVFSIALSGLENSFVFLLLSGVTMDIFSFSPIGLNTASFLIVFLAIAFLTKRLLVSQAIWRFFMIIFLVGVSSYLNDFTVNSLRVLFGQALNGKILFFSVELFKHALINMSVAFLLYWPLRKMISSGILSYENRSMIISRV